MRLLSNLLTRFIKTGTMTVIDAAGRRHDFGAGEPRVTLRLHDRRLYNKIAINPELYAGEAYMDGTLTFEDGSDVASFMYLFSLNRDALGSQGSQKFLRRTWRALRRWHQSNPVGVAAKNAQAHYDVSNEVYRLFLDEGLNYSCAFFYDPAESIEQAQFNKLERITAKLGLKPGMRVFEIGSGWGSMAIHIAKHTGAHVTAANVSIEQLKLSRERAAAAGVSHLIDFVETDYRKMTGSFDRIVSVGMMEHVGLHHFDEYFGKIKSLLKPDGWAMIHCIGRSAPPSATGPFIRKYIFPGAYVPSLSEVFAATERVRLHCGDMEVLRLHYHYTLQAWMKKFAANRAAIVGLNGERFARAWEYYLAAVDVGFWNGNAIVFQLLLSPTNDGVPIVRDVLLPKRGTGA